MQTDDTRCTPQPGSAGTLSQPDTPASPRVSDEDLAMWVEALTPEINYVHTNGTVGSAMARTILDLRDCRAELAAVRERDAVDEDAVQAFIEQIHNDYVGFSGKFSKEIDAALSLYPQLVAAAQAKANDLRIELTAWERIAAAHTTLAASQPEEAGRE